MDITLHCKTICPWCDMAKDWLTEHDFAFELILHDDDAERQIFYESCGEDVRSVPQIFVNGERIGGYRELVSSGLEYTKKVSFDSDF